MMDAVEADVTFLVILVPTVTDGGRAAREMKEELVGQGIVNIPSFKAVSVLKVFVQAGPDEAHTIAKWLSGHPLVESMEEFMGEIPDITKQKKEEVWDEEGAQFDRGIAMVVREQVVAKDRSTFFTSYLNCFLGNEAVDCICRCNGVMSREQAIQIGQKMFNGGVFYHYTNALPFLDEPQYYVFQDRQPFDRALATKLRANVTVEDRSYMLKAFPQCFTGTEAVDWLITQDGFNSRADAVQAGQELLLGGVFRHVTNAHGFKDEPLFYSFQSEFTHMTARPVSPRTSPAADASAEATPSSVANQSFTAEEIKAVEARVKESAPQQMSFQDRQAQASSAAASEAARAAKNGEAPEPAADGEYRPLSEELNAPGQHNARFDAMPASYFFGVDNTSQEGNRFITNDGL